MDRRFYFYDIMSHSIVDSLCQLLIQLLLMLLRAARTRFWPDATLLTNSSSTSSSQHENRTRGDINLQTQCLIDFERKHWTSWLTILCSGEQILLIFLLDFFLSWFTFVKLNWRLIGSFVSCNTMAGERLSEFSIFTSSKVDVLVDLLVTQNSVFSLLILSNVNDLN